MKEKLCTYAQTQLPGGKYWEPEPAIEAILKKISQPMIFVRASWV